MTFVLRSTLACRWEQFLFQRLTAPNKIALERDQALERTLDKNDELAGPIYGEPWFRREAAKEAINQLLLLTGVASDSIAGVYAWERFCKALGIKGCIFDEEEASIVGALRACGQLQLDPVIPPSDREALYNRDLLAQIQFMLSQSLELLGDAEDRLESRNLRSDIASDINYLRNVVSDARLVVSVLSSRDRT